MTGQVLTIGGLLLTVILAGISGYFYLRGQKVEGEQAGDITTVTMLTGRLAALTSEVEQSGRELSHMRELLDEKDRAIKNYGIELESLRAALTQRAEVDALRTESRAWFQAIGKATGATAPVFPN